jgi:hypothetical protein
MASTSSQSRSSEASLLYRLIRLYPHELGRTSVIWIIRFLYRFVFVLSWTLIVAQVSSAFHGGMSLPYLFLFHALLVFAGSITSYFLFQRYELEHIFLVSLIVGVCLLFGVQFLPISDLMKIGVLLFVESAILVQLSINIETFTERLFTPLESTRTFPVVESSDTVATLLAGLFLILNYQSLTATKVIWIACGVLALLVPLFLQYHSFIRSLPGLCLYRKQLLGHGAKEEKDITFVKAKKQPYIKLLVIIVLSQWFFTVVLEFLFTYSLSMRVLHQAELVPAAVGAVENVLVHEFGVLQVFFACATLVSNLLLAGRFMSSFGIIGSMVLHPIVALFSLAGMVVNFGFFSTVLSRVNAEVTGVIFRNSYQSSYYVFSETKSQFVRIILDGVVRPLGSLGGTLFLIASFSFMSAQYFVPFVLAGTCIVLVIFLITTLALQRAYTDQVVLQIKSPETAVELKISLLDVLAQKGHKHIYPFLQSLYASKDQSPIVRMKLIEIFSKEKDFIQEIIAGLTDEEFSVRLASLDALIGMSKRGFFDEQPLSRQLVVATLKKQYLSDTQEDLRYKMLLFLATFKDRDVMDFLVELLGSQSAERLGECIQACDVFGDPSFFPYIEEFMNSSDPRVWSSAAITLFKHERYEEKVLDFLVARMRDSSEHDHRALAFVFSEVSHKHFQSYMNYRMDHTHDPREKMLFAFGLIKLEDEGGERALLDMIFHDDLKYAHQARRLINHLPPLMQRRIDKIVQHVALTKLHDFLRDFSGTKLDDLSLDQLHYLRDVYTLLSVTEEIIEIDHIISEKDPSYRVDASHFGVLPLTPSLYV